MWQNLFIGRFFIYHRIHYMKVCNSVVFSIFTWLYNQNYLILEHSQCPKGIPYTLGVTPQRPRISFPASQICLSWTLYGSEIHTLYVWLLWPGTMLSFHPRCNLYRYCTPFRWQIIFHWVDKPLFVYHSLSDNYMGYYC